MHKKKMIAKDGSTTHPVDKHVGEQLRSRRMLLGISQNKLADAINITFQQIQKYERGANRISASRLFQLSKVLDVPISYFFENMPAANQKPQVLFGMADNEQEEFVGPEPEGEENIMNSRETIKLLRQYYAIKDPKIRKDIYTMVRNMALNMGEKDE